MSSSIHLEPNRTIISYGYANKNGIETTMGSESLVRFPVRKDSDILTANPNRPAMCRSRMGRLNNLLAQFTRPGNILDLIDPFKRVYF
ncbi:hypothetical protein PoB_007679600 [Plakobranchus ocellatus]|uniref:Uncharacterized protein n=1 Tax=Plakobranchus ocellatus TaxID=259542 RepID=A0AAV4E2R0_9GAST|nr:hypothetical protein PoB_007679600 [Plakobranchus ocellatus]